MNDIPKETYDDFEWFVHLGLATSERENTLTFLDDEQFIQQIISNPYIRGVITKENLIEKIKSRRQDTPERTGSVTAMKKQLPIS